MNEIRDALDDAIFDAYADGWMFMGESVTKADMKAQIVQDPGKMRHLARIQAAAWEVVSRGAGGYRMRDERFEYAVVLHKLAMAYDAADWDGCEPYPGLYEQAWALLHRDYGGAPMPYQDRVEAMGRDEREKGKTVDDQAT